MALGLAMDAFAVSVANGICYRGSKVKLSLQCGLFFGFFQALMPLIGFFAGQAFLPFISGVAHWIALILLSVIGGKMIAGGIKEMRSPDKCSAHAPRLSVNTLLVQALATSIDALAVGIGLGVMDVNIALVVFMIGIITFICSFSGVFIGRLFGARLSDKAQLLGGVVLILIGLNILLGG